MYGETNNDNLSQEEFSKFLQILLVKFIELRVANKLGSKASSPDRKILKNYKSSFIIHGKIGPAFTCAHSLLTSCESTIC